MTEKFYNDMFGDKHLPTVKPWKAEGVRWPTKAEVDAYWARKEREESSMMHRCPQCGCLFTGGEA